MSFKDIKGQDKAIGRLKQNLRDRALFGAYLFIGPEGVGKSLTAQTFTRALNCLKAEADCCDSCVSCLKIQKGQHPDVHIIDNGISEEIKIEQIRELEREINLRPYEARYKVFIINNAHNLNPVSANALLKSLEEPPQDSLIILCSDKPSMILKTIISRCKIVKFYPLVRQELFDILKNDYALDEKTLHYLAYFSEGRIGKALRLKDEDIIREKNRIIDSFSFNSPANLEVYSIEDKHHLRKSLQILAAWFRDMYLIKIGSAHDELINLDRRDSLQKLMLRYSFSDLDQILHAITNAMLYLEQNVNVKLLLADLMLSLKAYH
jgi:DNA polymerase-3 subunit delta'